MAKVTCWAYDPTTKLRCSRPGGHPGKHKVISEFEDDTVWVPSGLPDNVIPMQRPGVLGNTTEPPDADIAVGTCVVCQHDDPHLDPEEAGDQAGCQANGCMCLTAVRV